MEVKLGEGGCIFTLMRLSESWCILGNNALSRTNYFFPVVIWMLELNTISNTASNGFQSCVYPSLSLNYSLLYDLIKFEYHEWTYSVLRSLVFRTSKYLQDILLPHKVLTRNICFWEIGAMVDPNNLWFPLEEILARSSKGHVLFKIYMGLHFRHKFIKSWLRLNVPKECTFSPIIGWDISKHKDSTPSTWL